MDGSLCLGGGTLPPEVLAGTVRQSNRPISERAPEELRAKVKGTNRILTLMSDRDAIERSFGTKFRRGDSLQQTGLLCRVFSCCSRSNKQPHCEVDNTNAA
jgi:hypothetical protein